MSEHTIDKYQSLGQLPSQLTRPPRKYRTRQDPLAPYWKLIEERLAADKKLRPFAILDWLTQKSADPANGLPPVSSGMRRTLERRIRAWKIEHRVEQEVIFPQIHHPGDLIAFDFVVLNELRITIDRQPFDHMVFHSVLTYSNWEYVHLCHSESFEALSTGLQDALHRAGGVPQRVRSDSLTAAVNNLSDDREFNPRYQELLAHYGLQGHRINVRKPHENGDVESSHGHFKQRLDQALRLRGSRDFADRDAYVRFLRELVERTNQTREAQLQEERGVLRWLPAVRLQAHQVLRLKVPDDCVLRVKQNSYSVCSSYIGLQLEVQVHQDHLELWHDHRLCERLPRLSGKGKESIDFRHVIDSLVRKPGAFLNYKYREHMYPTIRFRMAFDHWSSHSSESQAVKRYLTLLKLAKDEGLSKVDDALRACFASGTPLNIEAIESLVKSPAQIPNPLHVHVNEPDLELFDSLLPHIKEYVYEDSHSHSASIPCPGQVGDEACLAASFAAYDEHVGAPGAAARAAEIGAATVRLGGPTGSAWSHGAVHDVPDAGAATAASQTRLGVGEDDQEAVESRGADHRRPGLRAAEPRGDGGAVHAVGGTLRTRERAAQQQPEVFQVGPNLQGPAHDASRDRPSDSSLGDHRAEYREHTVRGGQGTASAIWSHSDSRTQQRPIIAEFGPAILIVANELI